MRTMVALAAGAAAALAAAEECDIKVLAPMFYDLIDSATTCADATQYSFIPPTASPTAEQNAAICTKCATLIAKCKTKTFPPCTFVIDGTPTALDAYFAKVVSACPATSGSGSSSSSSTTTTPTVVAPSPTTAANTTTAPTPSPSSSANMFPSLSVAAVVAVATIASYAM